MTKTESPEREIIFKAASKGNKYAKTYRLMIKGVFTRFLSLFAKAEENFKTYVSTLKNLVGLQAYVYMNQSVQNLA